MGFNWAFALVIGCGDATVLPGGTGGGGWQAAQLLPQQPRHPNWHPAVGVQDREQQPQLEKRPPCPAGKPVVHTQMCPTSCGFGFAKQNWAILVCRLWQVHSASASVPFTCSIRCSLSACADHLGNFPTGVAGGGATSAAVSARQPCCQQGTVLAHDLGLWHHLHDNIASKPGGRYSSCCCALHHSAASGCPRHVVLSEFAGL
jgi:hypothetical protein